MDGLVSNRTVKNRDLEGAIVRVVDKQNASAGNLHIPGQVVGSTVAAVT